jgi:hypothetical protein
MPIAAFLTHPPDAKYREIFGKRLGRQSARAVACRDIGNLHRDAATGVLIAFRIELLKQEDIPYTKVSIVSPKVVEFSSVNDRLEEFRPAFKSMCDLHLFSLARLERRENKV